MSYLFAFSYCSWSSQGKNTEVVCHSLLQWATFCQTSPPWPNRLGWPHAAWLSYIELDKAVVLGSDWLVSCDCGFSLSALWCPLATPTVLLRFLLPWTWAISSQLLLTLEEGYLLSLAIKEMLIITTLRYCLTLSRVAKIRKALSPQMLKMGALTRCQLACKMVYPFCKTVGKFL